MKKYLFFVLIIGSVLLLVSCNRKVQIPDDEIWVAASYTPHAEILEYAKPFLEEKGYTLKIFRLPDYVTPNQRLTDGDVDANYFQHLPYLEHYNKQYGTDIVSVAGIHLEPIGIYSKTYTNLTNIHGATVYMSNSPSDEPRLIRILVDKKLIKLKEDVKIEDVRVRNIGDYLAENPYNLKFNNDIDPGLLVEIYKHEQNALVLINTNFALDQGLNPLEDALALESPIDNPYVNSIATRSEMVDHPKIKTLVEVLTSNEVKQFIRDTYNGAVIPTE